MAIATAKFPVFMLPIDMANKIEARAQSGMSSYCGTRLKLPAINGTTANKLQESSSPSPGLHF